MMHPKLLACICLFALVAGCKKYPEDDRRYLKSPLKRIAGKWKVEELLINDVDFTDSVFEYQFPDNNWASSPDQAYTFRGLIVDFQKAKNALADPNSQAKVVRRASADGYYIFLAFRKQLHLSNAPHPRASSNWYFNDIFTINKLTVDEMILATGTRKVTFSKVD